MIHGYQQSLRSVCVCLALLLVTVPAATIAAPRFVFAVNYIGGSVSTYRVDADTGMLHHIRNTPTLQNPSAMVLRPDGKFLYVTAQSLDEIAIYRVDQKSGTLTEIKNSPVPSGVRSSFRLAMSPDGQLLYVPGRFTSNLMVFRSDPKTGELTPLEDNNFPTHGKRARFVAVSPDGRFIYVTNTVSGTIAAFRVDNDNESVTAIDGMPFRVGEATVRGDAAGETIVGDSPQQVIIHPSEKFLYVPKWITGEMAGFYIDSATGALTPIPDFKAETGVFPFSGSIHPSGKYLYIANWLSSDVSTFHIDENTGHLSPLDKKPVHNPGDTPVNVRLDAEGRFAYVPNYHDSTLTVYQVDGQTGRLVDPRMIMTRPAIRNLSILEGEPVRYEPRWMVASDYDKAADKTTIYSYAIDLKTGEPESPHHLALDGVVNSLVVRQDAGLVFVGQRKTLKVFRLTNNGQLQGLDNLNVMTDGDIRASYIDQRGKHLYIATSNPALYIAYEINADDGSLKEVERVALPEGTQPSQITSSPEQRLNYVLDSAQNRIFVFRFLTRYGPNMFQLDRHGSPFSMGDGLSDFTIDATGQFGLALSSKGTVTVYQLPHVWGPLKKVGKAPLVVGKKPVAITMHPDGGHFYVLDAGGKRIHQLSLDTTNGKLTLLKNVISVKGTPQSLVIDDSGRFAYLQYADQKGLTRFDINSQTLQLEKPKQVLQEILPSWLAVTSEIR